MSKKPDGARIERDGSNAYTHTRPQLLQ